ncbi:MAG TPA: hypothetical protein ENK11_08575, partial [Phycisphaerales bacterium]|nr:hypothetical protein [Phycisphaerales bacterium]
AAAVAGGVASALASMVVAYSVGKKSLEPHRQTLRNAADRLEEMRGAFLALGDEDAAAYADLNAIRQLDAEDPRRVADEPGAVRRAVAAPRAVLDLSLELLGVVEGLVGITNPHLRSDLAVAAVTAESAAASAGWNVRVNIPLLPENEHASALDQLARSLEDARASRQRVEQACA